LAIVLQAGIIATVVIGERNAGTFQTASYGSSATTATGTFALVKFAPGATAEVITAFLQENQASLVSGPRGGLYRVQIAEAALAPSERDQLITRLSGRRDVIGFIAAAQ
jgi:hypothetical protein